jgi:anti-sigma regulatory factor (Ser/Thr protein kinase)
MDEVRRHRAQFEDVVRIFLCGVGRSATPDGETVLLVASELVANALQHAGGVTALRLSAAYDAVTVVVDDASRQAPHPAETAAGGLGRQFVQDVCTDVQVAVHRNGKSICAVVPCRTTRMTRNADGPAPAP